MTDGTISTIVSLLVGMLATSVAAVVVARTKERDRRRADEHEALDLRDARLRAELTLLEVRVGELRSEVEDLEGRRADLVREGETAATRGDPSASSAAGALRHRQASAELDRRLRLAGDARVIPFPFLADGDRD
jgi:uncharacterized protein YlxW (UPF0749 family)